jgi:hypothetical protein
VSVFFAAETARNRKGQTLLAQNSSTRERHTEYLNHGQNYGGILVIDPFL